MIICVKRRRRREREENNSRRSQEYEAEGGDEYTEGGGERADESEYSDLYAIPTEHSAPTRREMKDEVIFLSVYLKLFKKLRAENF